MPQNEVNIINVSERMLVDETGQLKPYYEVLYTIGTWGPFTKLVPKDQFDPDALKQEIEQEAQQLQQIVDPEIDIVNVGERTIVGPRGRLQQRYVITYRAKGMGPFTKTVEKETFEPTRVVAEIREEAQKIERLRGGPAAPGTRPGTVR